MAYEPRVILECSLNARDLGGIKTADGRSIAYGRLIRSGELSGLSEHDKEYLAGIGLHTVVDFRTETERSLKPDREMEGVRCCHLPVVEGLTAGITRESIENPYNAFSRPDYAELLGDKGFEIMRSLYPILAESESAVRNYRRFFELLSENESGAVLWHCAMGKDRAGLASALVLYALGVPPESVEEDYLLTGIRCAEEINAATEACRAFTEDETVLESVFWLNTTHRDYLLAAFATMEKLCGSVDAYLEEKLGVGESEKQRLRALYLS